MLAWNNNGLKNDDDEHEKLKNAINQQKAVSILVDTAGGKYIFLHTRLQRAKLIGKLTLHIHLRCGGFLGMLAGLAAKAVPALFGGLTTGLVS